MNLFDLFVKISVDTGEFDSGVDRVSKACKSLGGDMKTTGKDSEALRNKINSLIKLPSMRVPAKKSTT